MERSNNNFVWRAGWLIKVRGIVLAYIVRRNSVGQRTSRISVFVRHHNLAPRQRLRQHSKNFDLHAKRLRRCAKNFDLHAGYIWRNIHGCQTGIEGWVFIRGWALVNLREENFANFGPIGKIKFLFLIHKNVDSWKLIPSKKV